MTGRGGTARWLALGLAMAAGLALGGEPARAERGSPPLPSAIEAAAAWFVVERFLNGSNDLRAVRGLYGETVDYFDQGLRRRDQVMADKRAYFSRWPKRIFTPDLGTLRTRTIPGPDGRRDVEVTLEVDFDVFGPNRRANGRSEVALVLAERGEGFIVLAEGGRVIGRR
ncbi:MAG: hypothetical protein AAF909_01610 [Pseudomonadota bacterium]